MHTLSDCAARGTVTAGCRCAFCRGSGALRDGERVRVPSLFRDHSASTASKEINTMSNPHGLTRDQLAGVQINGRPAVDVFMLDGPSPAFLEGLAAGQRVIGVRPGLDAALARREAAHDAYADRLAGRDGIGGDREEYVVHCGQTWRKNPAPQEAGVTAEGDAYDAYRQRLAIAWESA